MGSNISIKLFSSNLITLLTIIFVISKILGYITWSWWLVFTPLWGPLVLVLGFLLIMFLGTMAFFIVEEVVEARARKRKQKQYAPVG